MKIITNKTWNELNNRISHLEEKNEYLFKELQTKENEKKSALPILPSRFECFLCNRMFYNPKKYKTFLGKGYGNWGSDRELQICLSCIKNNEIEV